MVANYTGLQKPLAENLASSYTTIQSQSTNITQHQPYSTVKSTSRKTFILNFLPPLLIKTDGSFKVLLTD